MCRCHLWSKFAFFDSSALRSIPSITVYYSIHCFFHYLPSLLIDAHEDGKEGFICLMAYESKLLPTILKIPQYLKHRHRSSWNVVCSVRRMSIWSKDIRHWYLIHKNLIVFCASIAEILPMATALYSRLVMGRNFYKSVRFTYPSISYNPSYVLINTLKWSNLFTTNKIYVFVRLLCQEIEVYVCISQFYA